MNFKEYLSNKGFGFSNRELLGLTVFLILLSIFVFLLIIAIFTNNPKPSSDSTQSPKTEIKQDLSARASVLARRFVKKFLKSPSTSDFPFLDFSVLELGNNYYSVQSYVDSQNSFGATIRTNWKAVIKYNGGNESDINNWTLRRLEFDGEEIYQTTEGY
jgi:hypothetical protein